MCKRGEIKSQDDGFRVWSVMGQLSGTKRMSVAIDPGHGGASLGVIADGFQEKEWTLVFSQNLQLALTQTTVDTIMTRESDVSIGFTARNTIAESFGADLVLSVHVNAAPPGADPELYSGATLLHWPGNEQGRQACIALESFIPSWLHPAARPMIHAATKDRWPRAHYLLSRYDATAILFEAFFATNPDDLNAMTDPLNIPRVAERIAAGLYYFSQHGTVIL